MTLASIEVSSYPGEILRVVSEHFQARGFASTTYVRLSQSTANLTTVRSATDVPEEYIRCITNAGLGPYDPVPGIAIETGRPVGYYEVERTARLTAKNREFFAALHASGLPEGIAFPAIGIGGRNAVIIARTGPDLDLATVKLHKLHCVVRAAHARIAQLEKEAECEVSPLSPKERAVLQWIAAGKSNKDIGTILGISGNTVATHTKRIFAKLEVGDRVAAALVGVRLGYISLDAPDADTRTPRDLDRNLLFLR